MSPVRKTLWDWFRRARMFLRGGPKPLGEMGEKYAAAWLKKKGWRIVTRNRRYPGGEIDLIAIDGQSLVFVEVRTRSSEDFMRPEESIQFHHKKRNVTRTVRKLARRYKVQGLTPRIDLVAIVWPAEAREPTAVRHHRGAMAVASW